MKHVIALSGGKDSTALALRLHELNPGIEYIRVVTPTGDELPDMFAHWRYLGERLGPLTVITADTTLEGLIDRWEALPNWRQRWCTRILKLKPYYAWLAANTPCVSYVGLRADEESRSGMEFREDIADITTCYPMREWGWGLSDVVEYLRQKNVSIPERTDCGSCFFQTLGEWHRLWSKYPDRYRAYEALEERISVVRGKATTFRSPSRDTWPAGLKELRHEFESGRSPIRRRDRLAEMKCRVCSL